MKTKYLWGYTQLFVLEKSPDTSMECKLSIYKSEDMTAVSTPDKCLYGTFHVMEELATQLVEYDN